MVFYVVSFSVKYFVNCKNITLICIENLEETIVKN